MSNLYPGLVFARTIALIVQTTGTSIAKRFEEDSVAQSPDTLRGTVNAGIASTFGVGYSEACKHIIQTIDAKLDDLKHERKHDNDERRSDDKN